MIREEVLKRFLEIPDFKQYEIITKLPEKILLSDYIEIKHLKCNHVYKVRIERFLKGRRCPKCNGGVRYTHEQFMEKFLKDPRHNEYKIIGKYINNHTPIKAIHIPCGEEVNFIPRNFFNGDGFCKKCKGLLKLTLDEIKRRIKELVGDEYEVLSTSYKNNKTKLKFFHNKCRRSFMMAPKDFYKKDGNRCPFCKESLGERKIEEFLLKKNILFERRFKISNCKYKKQLEFDFKINLENNEFCLVEYDGILHFKTWDNSEKSKKHLEEQQIRDKIKDKFCKEKNILLIRIRYNEDIEKVLSKYLDFS